MKAHPKAGPCSQHGALGLRAEPSQQRLTATTKLPGWSLKIMNPKLGTDTLAGGFQADCHHVRNRDAGSPRLPSLPPTSTARTPPHTPPGWLPGALHQHGKIPVPPQPPRVSLPTVRTWGRGSSSHCGTRKVGILGVPTSLSRTGHEQPERVVHLAAKQNKTRFLHFPTQLPCLALFPVFIFVHILVLFHGRTPQPIPAAVASEG